jgi:hypothetical protein
MMTPGFPCPNPACDQVFSPAAVQGVRELVCPRCRTVFQFRAGDAAPNRPATPVAPPPEAAPPVVVLPARRRPARPRSSLRVALYVLLGAASLLLLAWGGVWFAHVLRRADLETAAGGQTAHVEQGNFQFRVPGGAWKRDRRAQLGLNVV